VSDRETRTLIRAFLGGERTAVFRLSRWIGIEIWAVGCPAGRQREDLIQETLLRLWKALRRGDFRAESSLQRYVRAITRYVVVDQLRKKSSDREVTGEELGTTVIDEATPVDDRVANRDLAATVLAGLAEEDGRLLVEAYVIEKGYAEMAADRGISLGALKVRVFRAARRARAGWADLRSPHEPATRFEQGPKETGDDRR